MEELLHSVERLLDSDLTLFREERRRHSRILRVGVARSQGHQRLVIKQVIPDQTDPDAREAAAQRVRTEYAVMKRLYEGLETNGRFALVRPVACAPEHLALVMDEVSGTSLDVLIQRNGKGWPAARSRQLLHDACVLAGEWLRTFQTFTSQQGDPGPYLAALASEIRTYVDCLARRPLVRFSGELGAAVAGFVDRALRATSPGKAAVTGATGEFCPANTLVEGERLTVLDFGMYGLNTSLSDPAQFYQHLEMLRHKPLYRPQLVRELQRGFLEGYRQPALDGDPLFSLYRIKYKLSRMEATSGRKWPGIGPARRSFYRWVWRLQMREISQLLAAHDA